MNDNRPGPCPFCGSDNLESRFDRTAYDILCLSCFAERSGDMNSAEEEIEAWNRPLDRIRRCRP